MRTLKFRAWDKDRCRFEYFEIGENDDSYGIFRVAANKFDSVIEQYTDLKDKNGKEIYEGDIVKESNDWIHVVHWSKDEVGSCGCCVDKFFGTGFVITSSCDPAICEVIGNIHEKEKLLDKGEK